MKRFINFGSIDQLRTIIKNVQWKTQYTGEIGEDSNPILNKGTKATTVPAQALEKIHGTNASVCYSNPDGFWVQSRKNIITPEKDNNGCAFVQMASEYEWMGIIKSLSNEYNINLNKNIISVFFEWCGGNIQKNACVGGLDKMAIIFSHFKVSPIEPQTAEDGTDVISKWYETIVEIARYKGEHFKPTEPYINDIVHYQWVSNKDKNIFNVMESLTISLEIDFNKPDLSQNEMI